MEYVSAGESHGKHMMAILSGFPAGLRVDLDLLKSELLRRRSGKGRSKRLEFESDNVLITSGVEDLHTTGAPISFLLENVEGEALIEKRVKEKGFPRPGHVDFASCLKYGYKTISIGAERASARETALRVAAGSLCKMLLKDFDVEISSEVLEIGGAFVEDFDFKLESESGKSAGGSIIVKVKGTPVGLGSNVQWYNRLDSKISAALMSIPSVKGVYIGHTEIHRMRGTESLDHFENGSGSRKSNFAGGVEGGFSNGCDIDVTLFLKPIPTQPHEIDSYSVFDGSKGMSGGGRNDLWCVDRALVIAESVMSFVIADAFVDKFGCDCLEDIKSALKFYRKRIK